MGKSILILGSEGFIGSNLKNLFSGHDVFSFSRNINQIDMTNSFDLVVNCIGCNRSERDEDYVRDNVSILDHIKIMLTGKNIGKLINLSTIHAGSETIYGKTKALAEEKCLEIADFLGAEFINLRLPGVFGPGAKPHYNSVISTWCVQTINGEKHEVHDEHKQVSLLHIYEVYKIILQLQEGKPAPIRPHIVKLGRLSELISLFPKFVNSIHTFEPLNQFERYLFSTFISYFQPSETIYDAKPNGDKRGSFTEVLKFERAGQISVSITPPGAGVRGGHFHSGKIEKFYVASGRAQVILVNMMTGARDDFVLDAESPQTFITIPNWHHTIENISDEPLVLLLWSNEIFNPKFPDTINLKL